ncbi:MAG: hypothetical protein K2L13_01895 [Opitutales bacterium]|nr:hypothetical protein [Opitutales bacterium]
MTVSPLTDEQQRMQQICETFQKYGIEFLEVSADSLAKRNFRISNSIQTHLLIKTVSSIINRLGPDVCSLQNKYLSDYQVKDIQIVHENVAPPRVSLPEAVGDNADANDVQSSQNEEAVARKNTKSKKLPKDPRADLPYIVTLVPNQSENTGITEVINAGELDTTDMSGAEAIKCGYEIEVQRFTGSPYYVAREVQYAHDLHCNAKVGNAKLKLRKTYGCMFRFSDSYVSSEVLAVILPLCKDLVSTENQEDFPVCCAFVFLGKLIQAAEVIKKHLEEVKRDIESGIAADVNTKGKLNDAFEQKTSELSKKYEIFFDTSLEDCRKSVKKFCESSEISVGDYGGYNESDFDSNTEVQEDFNHIERFELLQLLAFSNLAQGSVVDELFSNTVRGLYMSNKVGPENIDQGYVDELWSQQKVLEAENEALKAKDETAKMKAALKIRNSFKPSENNVPWSRIKEVVDPNNTLKGRKLNSRVSEVIEIMNENGADFHFELQGKGENRHLVMAEGN